MYHLADFNYSIFFFLDYFDYSLHLLFRIEILSDNFFSSFRFRSTEFQFYSIIAGNRLIRTTKRE